MNKDNSTKHIGIRERTLLLTAFILAVVALISGFYFSSQSRRIIHESAMARVNVVGRTMAHNAERGLLLKDQEILERVLAGIRKEADLSTPLVFDRNAELVSLRPETLTDETLFKIREFVRRQAETPLPEIEIDQKREKVLARLYPIYSEEIEDASEAALFSLEHQSEQLIGYGILFFSPRRIESEIRRVQLTTASVVTALAVVVIGFLSILVTLLVNNIKKLLFVTGQVGQGKLDVRVDINSRDEIGELALQFNRMTEALQKTTVSRDLLLREVEERKRAEIERIKSEQKYRDLVQGLDAIVWESNPVTWKYTFVSQRAEVIAGYSLADWYSETDFWVSHLHPEDRDRAVQAYMRCSAKGREHEFEYRFIAKNGSVVWLRDIVHPVFDASGNVVQLRGLMLNVTEQKKAEEDKENLEEKLRQAQKLEAVGTLAGGIAHDFNNILWTVLGNVRLGIAQVSDGSPAKVSLEEIKTAAERGKDLVKKILIFGRQAEKQHTELYLSGIVQETVSLLRATLPSSIKLEATEDPNCGKVLADETEMQQIIMNLCTNAYHAIGDGVGTLQVKLKPFVAKARIKDSNPPLEAGTYVELSVDDTGAGIHGDQLERIFDPYFTTKEVGKGTGLGLSTVHGLVRGMKGGIRVHSVVGKGTTFKIYFPTAG